MDQVRVRFAPSPTGYLHVGGARTALYNWLFARHHKGKFILRIEDTDRTRSTEEAVQAILEGMKWLGLDWDEGPHHQADRVNIYKEHAEKLVSTGKAYKDGEAYRFKVPKENKIIVQDLIRGAVEFDSSIFDDFVIIKSDGFPTYNFAVVVDDYAMKITHVIRGDDHLSNTPRQILLYQAFGWDIPQFAHIPMIMGKDKARLSKRHGATSVIEYKHLGYLPQAMLNYLAKLGWGYGDEEIFSVKDLIKKFTLDRVNKTPAVFDMEKLNWLNGHYIRQKSVGDIITLTKPYLEKAYPKTFADLEKNGTVKKIVACLHDRIKTLAEIVPLTEYFFKDDFSIEQKAVDKYLKKPEAKEIIGKLREKLAALDTFNKENLEKIFKGLAEELQVKLGAIIHPTRALLTGRTQSPGIYDVVEILGKEKTLERLAAF